MSVVVGKDEYSVGSGPVTGRGFSWTSSELEEALAGPVAAAVFDDTGVADLSELLPSVSDTGFSATAIQGILFDAGAPEDWRVGEALAEVYLEHHRACFFPWPDGRDERKSGSSLPGADLVGFQEAGNDNWFAFGEIKTSSEGCYPPRIMYGTTGLRQQLEDIRDDRSLRDDLVRYLGFRAGKADWKGRYRRAAEHYVTNSDDVRVFGMMIRDVVVSQDDLRARVANLGEGCPSNMVFELLAIYLPPGSISTLGSRIAQLRQDRMS